MNPRVSVVILFYNTAGFLPFCLDSLARQTFKDFEVLLIDDGSTDNSLSICEGYARQDLRFRIIHYDRNYGQGYCRALSLSETKGKYIAILDSDDVAHPNRFFKQVNWLNRHKQAVLVASYYGIIDKHGRISDIAKPPLNDIEIRWKMTFGDCLGHSTIMFDKQAAFECGSYSRDISTGEDMDFISRLIMFGKVGVIPEVLAYWRCHGFNTTKRQTLPENKKILLRIVQHSIHRHASQLVSEEVASSVFNNSLEPACNLEVFLDALKLTLKTYKAIRDKYRLSATEKWLLKKCVFEQFVQLYRRNKNETWWPTALSGWCKAVESAAIYGYRIKWFAVREFLLFANLMGERVIIGLFKTILKDYFKKNSLKN